MDAAPSTDQRSSASPEVSRNAASPDTESACEGDTAAAARIEKKRRSRRNLALALVLAAFVGLVYLITIARIGSASGAV
ncbi:MAG: hypothetical protein Tsb0010_06440 [Parvularculaceae bacterium]